MVEFQPSKLAVVGSNPIARSIPCWALPKVSMMGDRRIAANFVDFHQGELVIVRSRDLVSWVS